MSTDPPHPAAKSGGSRGHGVAIGLTAAVFVAAGALHFVKPAAYARIVPPGLPSPRTLVAVSGVAEIVGGLGLLAPGLRRPAGWGLIALLIAVFPANVYMAARPDRFADLNVPTWLLWARLPLQGLLIEGVRRLAARTRGGGCRRTSAR